MPLDGENSAGRCHRRFVRFSGMESLVSNMRVEGFGMGRAYSNETGFRKVDA